MGDPELGIEEEFLVLEPGSGEEPPLSTSQGVLTFTTLLVERSVENDIVIDHNVLSEAAECASALPDTPVIADADAANLDTAQQ